MSYGCPRNEIVVEMVRIGDYQPHQIDDNDKNYENRSVIVTNFDLKETRF